MLCFLKSARLVTVLWKACFCHVWEEKNVFRMFSKHGLFLVDDKISLASMESFPANETRQALFLSKDGHC
jgi:hypothetical protein